MGHLKNKSTEEILFDIFGTPNPSKSAVARWRRSWRGSDQFVKVSSYTTGIKIILESEINSLYYQLINKTDEHANNYFCIVFFKEEDAVFFKLHNDIA